MTSLLTTFCFSNFFFSFHLQEQFLNMVRQWYFKVWKVVRCRCFGLSNWAIFWHFLSRTVLATFFKWAIFQIFWSSWREATQGAPAIFSSLRQAGKTLPEMNTWAYCAEVLMTRGKSFINLTPGRTNCRPKFERQGKKFHLSYFIYIYIYLLQSYNL